MTGKQLRRRRKELEMTLYGRSSRWVVALALGLASLIGVGAAMVPAAPASTAASAFELTLEEIATFDDELVFKHQGTFRSGAPFCGSGTMVDPLSPHGALQLACDDGSGSLTVSIAPVSQVASPWNATWRIRDGSGSYAGLRGKGSLRTEVLRSDPGGFASRSTFQGVVDRDAVAPTITLSSTVTKLGRPAGAYSINVALALRDDVEGNPVSYTLRVATIHRGIELARTSDTTTNPTRTLTFRIKPPRVKAVRLQLAAEDPLGNASSLTRALKLPR
jgi:hypothetical protein